MERALSQCQQRKNKITAAGKKIKDPAKLKRIKEALDKVDRYYLNAIQKAEKMYEDILKGRN